MRGGSEILFIGGGDDVPWNIPPLLNQTDLILASRFTELGSAPRNQRG
jgi:hypothetical protein